MAGIILAVMLLAGLPRLRVQEVQATADGTVDYETYAQFLRKYVDSRGNVDYAGIQGNVLLADFLKQIEEVDLDAMSSDERLAFWINAYNALAIELVARRYPVGSILDITPVSVGGWGLFIPKVNDPFQMEVAPVAGEPRSLDEIEHDIIRERFDEPRIHFALVCAAVSCPRLRQEPYRAADLNRQLQAQTRAFLHNPDKNQIPASSGVIRLSKIFDWYGADFERDGAGLQPWIAPYFNGQVRERLEKSSYRVKFLDYNWSLNDQSK